MLRNFFLSECQAYDRVRNHSWPIKSYPFSLSLSFSHTHTHTHNTQTHAIFLSHYLLLPLMPTIFLVISSSDTLSFSLFSLLILLFLTLCLSFHCIFILLFFHLIIRSCTPRFRSIPLLTSWITLRLYYFCLRPSTKDQGITWVVLVVVLVHHLVHFLIKRNLSKKNSPAQWFKTGTSRSLV